MIRKVEHVALLVHDMDQSIEFYREMFGFSLRARGQNATRDMAFLYLDSQPGFEIELMQDLVDLGEYSEKGIVNHLAFTVENIEEAMAFYQEKGIVFNTDKPNTAIDGAKTIFFYGPNRELLQFVQPVRRDY